MTTDISTTQLALKYGIAYSGVARRSAKEKWPDARREYNKKVEQQVERISIRKNAEEIFDTAASKARIRAKLYKMCEKWLDDHQDIIEDTNDFRRIAQTCLDLCNSENDDKTDNDIRLVIEGLPDEYTR